MRTLAALLLPALCSAQYLIVSPSSVTISPGQSVQLTAALGGISAPGAVTNFSWRITGVPFGSIDQSGLYVAPLIVTSATQVKIMASANAIAPGAAFPDQISSFAIVTVAPSLSMVSVAGTQGPQGIPGPAGPPGPQGPPGASSNASGAVLIAFSALAMGGPFIKQTDGSWLLANAALPVNPWGGVPFTGSAIAIFRNGLLTVPDGIFQVVIAGSGQGPYSIQVLPVCPLPPCSLWSAGDDVRAMWVGSLTATR